MRDLNHQLKQLCRRNRDGSHATQRDRERVLTLIPSDRNYRQQLRVYERHTANAGLSKLHGLRHQYAQSRYEELTGWKAPGAGGPPGKMLGTEQRALDREARLTISGELGHERAQIVAVYCG